MEKQNNSTINASSSALNSLRFNCMKKKIASFNNLPIGQYVVNKFSIVETSHGTRVRIDLDETYMYLPERFTKLTPDKIEELSKSSKIMIYDGKDSANKNRLILDFAENTVENAMYSELFSLDFTE